MAINLIGAIMLLNKIKSNASLSLVSQDNKPSYMVGSTIIPHDVLMPVSLDIHDLTIRELIIISSYIKSYWPLHCSVERVMRSIIKDSFID
jgi:hypothetical protein